MSGPQEGTERSRSAEPELNLGELLSAGVGGLASVTGLQLVVALGVLGLAGQVVYQSVLSEYVAFAREQATDPEVIEVLDQFGSLPLAFDIPVGAAFAAMVVLPIVAEAVNIVGVRAFADGALDGLSGARVWPNLTKATILGFLGGSVLLIATSLGLALLLAPGIFIAVVTVFFRQEIAVADKGIVDSIRGSLSLTKGHRWDLLGLLFVLVVVGIGVFLVTLPLPGGALVIAVVDTVLSTAAAVFSLAVVTEAYVTLRDRQPEETDVPMGPEEIDRTDWNTDDSTQW